MFSNKVFLIGYRNEVCKNLNQTRKKIIIITIIITLIITNYQTNYKNYIF